MRKQKNKLTIKTTSYFFKNNDNLWNHSFSQKIHYSHLVTLQVIDYIQKNNIQSVCLFLSELDQINTLGIIKWCFQNKIATYIFNFEPSQSDFEVYPINDLDFEIVDVKSYKNILISKSKEITNKKIDLIIVPVYFTDDNKMSFYYEMKNYSQVMKINHNRLIGIGFENVTINHKFWNFLKKKNKFYRLICDEIFLASKLI